MKIAITSSGNSLQSAVDPRFGRCSYFIIYDDKTSEFQVLDNGAQSAAGGAGVEAARLVSQSGAEVVLTGEVGPKAFQALNAAGMPVSTGAEGTVKETIEKYKAGKLGSQKEPSVSAHSGLK
jgi:predicted Fe-Mo cluster-binding NifX family protein